MVGWGIRVDRCGCLRRPMRMVKYAEGVRGRCVRGAWVWQDAVPSYARSL